MYIPKNISLYICIYIYIYIYNSPKIYIYIYIYKYQCPKIAVQHACMDTLRRYIAGESCSHAVCTAAFFLMNKEEIFKL